MKVEPCVRVCLGVCSPGAPLGCRQHRCQPLGLWLRHGELRRPRGPLASGDPIDGNWPSHGLRRPYYQDHGLWRPPGMRRPGGPWRHAWPARSRPMACCDPLASGGSAAWCYCCNPVACGDAVAQAHGLRWARPPISWPVANRPTRPHGGRVGCGDAKPARAQPGQPQERPPRSSAQAQSGPAAMGPRMASSSTAVSKSLLPIAMPPTPRSRSPI